MEEKDNVELYKFITDSFMLFRDLIFKSHIDTYDMSYTNENKRIGYKIKIELDSGVE